MGNPLALRTEGKKTKRYDSRNVRIVKPRFACCKKEDIMGKELPKQQSASENLKKTEEIKASELSEKEEEIWDWYVKRKAKHKVRVYLDEEEIEAVSPRMPGLKEAVGDGSATAMDKSALQNLKKAGDDALACVKRAEEIERGIDDILAEYKKNSHPEHLLTDEECRKLRRNLNPLMDPEIVHEINESFRRLEKPKEPGEK